MPKSVKAVVGAGIAVVVAGVVIFLNISRHFVPPEFSEARIKGAELAKNISASAGASLEALALIRAHDERREGAQALIVISQEVVRNREIQQEAIRLASELERMARLIPDVQPVNARLMAAEAVSAEVALVSRLVSYNNNLFELFGVLKKKFEHPGTSLDGRVQVLVDKINEEAHAINSFNERFNWSLAEFDKVFADPVTPQPKS